MINNLPNFEKYEIKNLEKLYGYKIRRYYIFLLKRINKNPRYYCNITFEENENKSAFGLTRSFAAWRLEAKIEKKLHTRRNNGNETVDHIDGNPINDDPNNLQLLTMRDNNYKSIIQNKKYGSNTLNAKLKEEDINSIRDDYYKNYIPLCEISKKYFVNKETVRNILNNKTWKHVKYNLPKKININYNGGFKLKIENINQIRNDYYLFGLSIKNISIKYCVNFNTIEDIIFRNAWKNVLYDLPIFNINIYNKNFYIKLFQIIIINNIKYKFIGKGMPRKKDKNIIYINSNNQLIKK